MAGTSAVKSTKWALKFVGMAGFSGGRLLPRSPVSPGAQAAVFELMNMTTGETRILSFSGGGLTASLFKGRAQASVPHWITFETEQPHVFDDFQGPARMGNVSAGLGTAYSHVFVVFSEIDIKQAWWKGEEIDMHGLGAGTGVDVSWYPLGAIAILGKDDQDTVKTLKDAGPRDAGPGPAAGVGGLDTRPSDAGPDAAPRDAGLADAGPQDAGPDDAPQDAGARDAPQDTWRDAAYAKPDDLSTAPVKTVLPGSPDHARATPGTGGAAGEQVCEVDYFEGQPDDRLVSRPAAAAETGLDRDAADTGALEPARAPDDLATEPLTVDPDRAKPDFGVSPAGSDTKAWPEPEEIQRPFAASEAERTPWPGTAKPGSGTIPGAITPAIPGVPAPGAGIQPPERPGTGVEPPAPRDLAPDVPEPGQMDQVPPPSDQRFRRR